jgi:hypothetical protein
MGAAYLAVLLLEYYVLLCGVLLGVCTVYFSAEQAKIRTASCLHAEILSAAGTHLGAERGRTHHDMVAVSNHDPLCEARKPSRHAVSPETC